MDEYKMRLKGSEKRDLFKQKHKEKLRRDDNFPNGFYASDADLILVEKNPPGIAAYLDYKDTADSISFSEVIVYNIWIGSAPVFIVQASDPENGPFQIFQYRGGDYHPDPPEVDLEEICKLKDWDEYKKWEYGLRVEYRRRHLRDYWKKIAREFLGNRQLRSTGI